MPTAMVGACAPKFCDLLDIEFPIFAFSHCRDVVAAVSRAGGFDVLGAVGFTPEQLAAELDWIDKEVGDNSYGVDIVIPQNDAGAEEGSPQGPGVCLGCPVDHVMP